MQPSNALSLLKSRSEDQVLAASERLGKANALIAQLGEHKEQISHALEQATFQTATGGGLQNHFAWRARLYQMDEACARATAEIQQRVEQARTALVDAQVEKLKYETLINRQAARTATMLAKKEQKLCDEFAAAAWRRRSVEKAKENGGKSRR